MSSKDKPKGAEPTVKVVEKKVLNQELDTFLDYVLAQSKCFPLSAEGASLPDGYLSETEPVLGPLLKIHALFLRGARESDTKRKPRDDGKPYPSWFILSHGTCRQRLVYMETRKKSRGQSRPTSNLVLVILWSSQTERVLP